MSVDKERLRELDDRVSADLDLARDASGASQGVRKLLRSVHRNSDLRDFVTVESATLVPVPHLAGVDVELSSLLAVPERRGDEQVRYHPAWGLVTWRWPDGTLARTIDLGADLPDGADRTLVSVARAKGSAWDAPPIGASHTRREVLLDEIEAALRQQWPPAREHLERLRLGYEAVLPPGAIRLYAALLPAVGAWLDNTRR